MPESASAIVFDKTRTRVLLVKREDFRVWALPGGGIEASETHEQAAVRETCEEPGHEIVIDRLICRCGWSLRFDLAWSCAICGTGIL